MFSWIRRRATYANVAMTLALVFAMTGGAYAAKKYLITSTKQISPSVLKQLVGKTGPAGANGKDGAPGSQGPQGPEGANGKDGVNGTNGQEGPAGAKGATGPQGPAGTKGTNGTNGATGPKGPTGPEGEINTEGPLPEGKTEHGTWAVGVVQVPATTKFANPQFVRTVVSFAIPLAAPLDSSHIHAVNSKGEELVGEEEFVPTECKGSIEAPSAPSGELCVYYTAINTKFKPSPFIEKLTSTGFQTAPGASIDGALIEVLSGFENEPEDVSGWGSWAVTG